MKLVLNATLAVPITPEMLVLHDEHPDLMVKMTKAVAPQLLLQALIRDSEAIDFSVGIDRSEEG